uniref:Uncharacterized protein n=1 Tax=Sphaerodactylus townsendi TaxID=933632 RepID=A0ACB8EME2_9SAUR
MGEGRTQASCAKEPDVHDSSLSKPFVALKSTSAAVRLKAVVLAISPSERSREDDMLAGFTGMNFAKIFCPITSPHPHPPRTFQLVLLSPLHFWLVLLPHVIPAFGSDGHGVFQGWRSRGVTSCLSRTLSVMQCSVMQPAFGMLVYHSYRKQNSPSLLALNVNSQRLLPASSGGPIAHLYAYISGSLTPFPDTPPPNGLQKGRGLNVSPSYFGMFVN